MLWIIYRHPDPYHEIYEKLYICIKIGNSQGLIKWLVERVWGMPKMRPNIVHTYFLGPRKRRGDISSIKMFNPKLWKNKAYYMDLKHKMPF